MTCREFLGRDRGYCPQPPAGKDRHGYGFCTTHLSARGLA